MDMTPTPARTADHPVADLFLKRWSPRAFGEATLDEAQVLTVLEAARWAPSANNNQPWRFAYGLRGDAGFAAIAEALSPGNRLWAEKAGALIVLASATTVSRNGAEVPNGTHAFDTGAAWAMLAVQAQLSGLISHAMGGFDHDKMRAGLNVPASFALHAVVALGHAGDPAALPDTLRAREVPNQRRPLNETMQRGRY
jgi:nitroreductase